MNFLAHLFLSGENEELLIGNFIADSVKGKSYLSYSPGIQKGILLHRAIDEFTDKHLEVKKSIEILRPKYSKYSGVLVDIFYDHFLAVNWKSFSPYPLPIFANKVYQLIDFHLDYLPPITQIILENMKAQNWLVNYGNMDGINRTLDGMSKRTRFVSNMELAGEDLLQHYEFHKENFNNFFPKIIQFLNTNI